MYILISLLINYFLRCVFIVPGYKCLIQIIQNESEKATQDAREVLNHLTPDLLNKLDVQTCTDKLFEKEIISESDKEEIESKQNNEGSTAALKVLLDKLPRKCETWNTVFADILREHGLEDQADLICSDDKEKETSHRIGGRYSFLSLCFELHL